MKRYVRDNKFKIQYGEIYSIANTLKKLRIKRFKIQYGEIYSTAVEVLCIVLMHLKSSMERFIDL